MNSCPAPGPLMFAVTIYNACLEICLSHLIVGYVHGTNDVEEDEDISWHLGKPTISTTRAVITQAPTSQAEVQNLVF